MPDINAVLISTRYDVIHDDAFARQQLGSVLESLDGVSFETAPDYGSTSLIERADALITYIARRSPNDGECDVLHRFLDRGGRWFAIHTSNAVEPDCLLPALLGSRFITHPPYGPVSVSVTKPEDLLLAGIEPFEVEDELYVIDAADDIEVLLHTRWGGEGRPGTDIEEGVRPMLYRRRVGQGEVLYFALGHCNPPGVVTRGGTVGERRGSWQSPVFQELVRRGVRWAARRG